MRLEAPVVGINARDLSTFAIDREAQLRLLGRIPSDRIVVAESGIGSRAQGAAAELAGADAILVGSALMRAPDPAAKLAELVSRPLIKVCGLTRGEDVAVAADAGADLLGFVLEPASPRAAECVLPVPDDTLSVAVWVGDAGESDADLDQVHTVEDGKVRGRQATIFRRGEPVARLLDLPWGEPTRTTGSVPRPPTAGSSSPAVSAPRTSRTRSPPSGPGRSTPRRRSRARRASKITPACAPTSRPHGHDGARGDLRSLRRPVRPGDADPRARRADGRVGRCEGRPAFAAELDELGRTYVGRPSPITLASASRRASAST